MNTFHFAINVLYKNQLAFNEKTETDIHDDTLNNWPRNFTM